MIRRSLRAVAIALVLSVAAGMLWSAVYWRYVFAPPSWAAAVERIAVVEAAQLTGLEEQESGVEAVRAVAKCDDDAFAAGRLGCELLKKRGLRIDGMVLGPRTARDVLAELGRRELLFDGEPEYPDARKLRGLIVLAKGADGDEYVLAALNGLQASNDHYPQYHAIFRLENGAPRLVSVDRYFVDFAGIEGATWWMFAAVAAIVLVPGSLLVVLIRWALARGGTPSAFPSRVSNE